MNNVMGMTIAKVLDMVTVMEMEVMVTVKVYLVIAEVGNVWKWNGIFPRGT